MEVQITNENFESVKNGSLPIVIDFWATWCGPCRMISPIISELAEGEIVDKVVGAVPKAKLKEKFEALL